MIPIALTLGCNDPVAVNVLSDFIEEATGHPLALMQSGYDDGYCRWLGDGYENGNGFGNGMGFGYENGDGGGYGDGDGYGNGHGGGGGYGYGYGDGYGVGYGFLEGGG